ncbi:MAG: hypothetical protein EZS28_008889 [Streblomastix strix]|uniref:Uncharacterized protein n=1 Tax=Streblomastix strix TaxID=222440 RepID=A0A5J4WLZ1_9EUKA|nr:MAG: hypothetical protein EZS28_008889 [Streblomastix strix]
MKENEEMDVVMSIIIQTHYQKYSIFSNSAFMEKEIGSDETNMKCGVNIPFLEDVELKLLNVQVRLKQRIVAVADCAFVSITG